MTLDTLLEQAQQQAENWVFGYASLIWRPEFEATASQRARAYGWHRALQMRSRINRGTPECPGLVFTLLQGGSCQGLVYRLNQASLLDDLTRLWSREMPTATYRPRWVQCHTAGGKALQALAFTLPTTHPSYTGPIDDASMLEILRHARGRFGTTLDYLVDTQRGLHQVGIRDAAIDRLVQLARRAGLL